MNANKKILIIAIVIVSVITVALSFNKIDPFYKTDVVIHGEIKNLIYSTGKFGAGLRVVVEIEKGKVLSFAMPVHYSGSIGDKVKLHLYKRNLTGAEKYDL